MSDRATGPITPDEMQRIASLPFGAATAELRKHDPLWGREPGEKIKWRVRYVERVRMRGQVIVEASSEEEALKIADKMAGNGEVDCDEHVDHPGGDIDLYDVVPL